MRLIFILLTMLHGFTIFGQDKVFLKSGEVIKGKIIENTDSTVVIKTQRLLNDQLVEMDMSFYKSKIDKLDQKSYLGGGTKVIVELVGGRRLDGWLESKNDQGIVLAGIKGVKFDTLALKNRQIKQIKYNGTEKTRFAFMDIGILRGGALIGAELELVINPNTTLFVGAGFRGFSGGINIFFKDGLKGLGFKSGYIHQGFGGSYAGSIFSNGITFKSNPGLSLDLGLGLVTKKGRYNYGGRTIILTYGIGYRF